MCTAMRLFKENAINKGVNIGLKQGMEQETLMIVTELFQNFYPNESINFLNDCTIEQLKQITTMLIQKESIQNILASIYNHFASKTLG